ncbi:MAG: hypothetical protein KF838_01860 [Phycisphaeraceae bacterium]|nr:MAG: hypothetical protein KF838_01860 [Phycisphaeraceae bacterium]
MIRPSLVVRLSVVGFIAVGGLSYSGPFRTTASTAADASHIPMAVKSGAMRPVMREGKTEPRIRLADAIAQPHLFAVGAMAGLAGEITIADGEVWVSQVVNGQPVTSGPAPGPGDHATLLAGFSVERWYTVPLTQPLAGEALDAAIEQAARQRGIDTAKPFPFRIKGDFAALDMHIINGFCPHGGGEADAALQPWKSNFAMPVHARVVGIFARGAEGVLTHHGTAVHAHALTDTPDGLVTGHIDAMGVAEGAVLLLPAQ